ncbi:YceI family protein [Pseudonocardia xinjiangensis]|uniref:YceI family protein n=1 Tax=Pseudonocardia xinjiangensis TaxID=75289 RepID=UPI003D8BFE18
MPLAGRRPAAARDRRGGCGGWIDPSGVDTDNETPDPHLRSPDFRDGRQYPEIRYKSDGLRRGMPRTGLSTVYSLSGAEDSYSCIRQCPSSSSSTSSDAAYNGL